MEEGLGWASEGWNPDRAAEVRARIKEALRTGQGARSLAEMRQHADAERAAQEMDRKRAQAKAVTLDQAADRFLEWARENKKSAADDVWRYNKHVRQQLGHMPMTMVTGDHLETIKQDLLARKAPATVRHVLALVRRIYSFAEKTGLEKGGQIKMFDGRPPTRDVAWPTVENDRLRYLTRPEAELVLDRAKNYPPLRRTDNTDLHDAILLSLYTGMRLGEIRALQWPSVDLEGRVIHVLDAKGGTGLVRATPSVRAMLQRRAALVERKAGLVFPPILGKGQRGNLGETFSAMATEMGLNDGITDRRHLVTFHTLRHTYASWLALQGTDIYRIKKLMRHKTISQTMRYAHLIPDATWDAADSLDPGVR